MGALQLEENVGSMEIEESRHVICIHHIHWKPVTVNFVYVYPPIQLVVVATDLPMQTGMHG
jgi:hypothetical protein